MLNDKIFRKTFIISSIGHFLCLALMGRSVFFFKDGPRNIKDMVVNIEIEQPPLLPEIDIMGEEKKLLKAESKSEEIVMEESAEPVFPERSVIEVIDPAKEAMLRYQDMVKQRIESTRMYPVWAKRQGMEGVVHLNFTVLSNGLSQDINIVRPSGCKILDEEAVNNVKRANPFPPVPENIKASSIQMDVSIVYTLK